MTVASDIRIFFRFVAISIALSAGPTSAGVPTLNSQKICKTRDTNVRMFKSTTGQTVDECVHDEESAKQQLSSLWDTTSARSRNECMGEGHALGTTSYLDLLTCIQMAEEMKTDPQKKISQPVSDRR